MIIRQATLADAETLLEWRNDPLTREMSRSSQIVEWEMHIAWLTSRLARSEPDLYIAEIDGAPIGTFRIDGDEISYTVAPKMRQRGHGGTMLAKARTMFGVLRAEIFERNAASISIARHAGLRVEILADQLP